MKLFLLILILVLITTQGIFATPTKECLDNCLELKFKCTKFWEGDDLCSQEQKEYCWNECKS